MSINQSKGSCSDRDPLRLAQPPMNDRPTIVITVDGLARSAIGCYGSSWNRTPWIDTLASESCLWDRFIGESTDPWEILRGWMSEISGGELVMDTGDLSKRGIDGRFDQSWLVEIDETLKFSDSDSDKCPVDSISDTHLAALFAAALERFEDAETLDLLWIHTSFLTRCWDAPRSVDRRLDEVWDDTSEDEGNADANQPPWEFNDVQPPYFELQPTDDPDLAVSWMRTYAAQVNLLDQVLGMFLETIGPSHPKVVLAGTSGFALGENGWIGFDAGPLRSCHHHLPLLCSGFGGVRLQAVTGSSEIRHLFQCGSSQDCLDVSPDAWAATQNDYTPSVQTVRGSDEVAALTTPRWYVTRDDAGQASLFLKPDDVHDASDVHRIEQSVASKLLEMFDPS